MTPRSKSAATVLLAALACAMLTPARMPAQILYIAPDRMQRTGSVDERFQAYNVEMVEVTGGRFWKPYSSKESVAAPAGQQGSAPAGLDPNLFQYRPPIDLSNARLRTLAAALGPAYVRVSGTWANTVYFHDSDSPAPATPPAGYGAVLTRKEWKGVIDFARAANAGIISSFAIGAGTRDAAGAWSPEQARRILAYTKAQGGSIAAAEFMNEPNLAAMGGAPKGYDAAAYARDVRIFRRLIETAAPDMLLLGPGSVAEGGVFSMSPPGAVKTEDLLKAAGPVFDGFSYHLYPTVSKRCAGAVPAMRTKASDVLSEEWLARPDAIHAFYAALRDRFEPGKPLWITETADAACGGNPWASTFLDTFRYLVEHAGLAQKGVQVIAHNTLASSDYGLLDEATFAPRPNYWAALLWRRFMGTTVLNPGPAPGKNLYTYAHCQRGQAGGVAVLAINADASAGREIEIPTAAERYTLTAARLQDTTVQLNGHTLELGRGDSLPALTGVPVRAGRVALSPASITFLVFPKANNSVCR
jgi:heparanase